MLNKKEKILAAARAVIAKKGFDKSTIKEIAESAGVAQGTPYLYFKNKEALFLELLLSFEKELDRIIDEAIRIKGDFWKKIEYIVKNNAGYLSKNSAILQIMKKELPDPVGIGKKGKSVLANLHEERMKRMFTIFDSIRGGTVLNSAFTDNEVKRLCMMLVFGMIKRMEMGYVQDPDEVSAFIVKCLKEALIR